MARTAKYYKPGMRCMCCGRHLTAEQKGKTQVTLDHVYPKTISGYSAVPVIYQTVCLRCNNLKGMLAPTAFVYRIIGMFSALVPEESPISVKKITECYHDKVLVGYNVKLKANIILNLPCDSSKYTLSFVGGAATEVYEANKKQLKRVIRYIYQENLK